MRADVRFWRNVTIIALAHAIVVFGLARWSSGARKNVPQNITWMDAAAFMPEPAVTPPPVVLTPSNDLSSLRELEKGPEPPAADDAQPAIAPAKSEIELPTPTAIPTVTPKPHPTAIPTPRPIPKLTATPVPKPTPKPKAKRAPKTDAIAKVKPRPSAKPVATPPAREDNNADGDVSHPPVTNNSPSNSSGAAGGTGVGSAKRGSQFGWYGSMLHDRLYSEWVQPTSVVASGAKMSALVKLRIEKDGRVSQFEIVKPSGNVVVDESVAAVAKRVSHVDPLPKGLGGEFYEVKINFELNPE